MAHAIGADSRIGSKFLKAGPGFGGSCFQKDILNLVYLCGHYGLNVLATYWQSVVDLNVWQQHRIARLVVQRLFGTVTGKRIAVLGFAFKADTNDTREAPAIRICQDLLEEGAQLAIFDPRVSESQVAKDLGSKSSADLFGDPLISEGHWKIATSPADAVTSADCVLVLTEWSCFTSLDWRLLASLMRKPAWLFDTRSIADLEAAQAAGLSVWRIGSGLQ